MKKFQLANVSSPSVELEVGDHVVQSSVIKNTKKNPNFDQPLYFFDIVSIHNNIYLILILQVLQILALILKLPWLNPVGEIPEFL